MRWLYCILWVLTVTGLLALAVLPYTPSILNLWQDYGRAWQIVRQENSSEPPFILRQEEMPNKLPSPPLLDDSVSQGAEEDTAGIAEDFFQSEARARAAEDPEAAMQWLLTEADPDDRLRGMLEIVAIWAADDSESALLWLEENAGGIARRETLHHGMSLWSQQDPLAAAAWIEGMANDSSKSTAIEALLQNWAKDGSDEALDWFDRLESGTIRKDAGLVLVDALMQSDPADATRWALNEAIKENHPELLDHSMAEWALIDPTAAAQYLEEINAFETMPGATRSYLKALTLKDPTLAGDWLATLDTEDPIYSEALNTTFLEEWSRSDSVAASNWLAQAAPGPTRDAAIIGFASSMMPYEPAAVAEWTRVIEDPQTKENWLTHTLQTWARNTPEEAIEWVWSTDLEPGLRNHLIEAISKE